MGEATAAGITQASKAKALKEEMESHALDAIADARVNHNATLIWDPECVRLVEAILSKLYDKQPLGFFQKIAKKGISPLELDKYAKMYGGYVGELLRNSLGGEWGYDETSAPGYKLVALTFPNRVRVFPPLRVHQRLTKGPKQNVWDYFQELMKQKNIR